MLEIGQTVRRLEAREVVEARIIDRQVVEGTVAYLLEYAEGGEGWWPADAIESEE